MLLSACARAGAADPAELTQATPAGETAAPSEGPQESLLDGVLLEPAEYQRLSQRRPLAVMVENQVSSRPSYGLGAAELVYEAVAEGGITRFMAVYWRNEPPSVEPVRSARLYFAVWALEIGAVYLISGEASGPPEADARGFIDREEIPAISDDRLSAEAGVFRRDPQRQPPHNLIASSEGAWRYAAAQGWVGPPDLERWRFKDEAITGPAATIVDVRYGDWSDPEYFVRWLYDQESNTYLRTQGGEAHMDALTGEQIRAASVVVHFAAERPASDGEHLVYELEGTGRALIFLDGVAIDGRWRKEGLSGRTRYYDDAGNEVAFNRGTVWVHLVAQDSPITYQ